MDRSELNNAHAQPQFCGHHTRRQPASVNLLISDRVLFDKTASVYFIREIYCYFSIGNGQPGEPAIQHCAGSYRHTFVAYRAHMHVTARGVRVIWRDV